MKPPIFKALTTGFSRAAATATLLLGVLGAGERLQAQGREPAPASASPQPGGQSVAAAANSNSAVSTIQAPPPVVPRPGVEDVDTRGLTETQIVAREGADFDAKGRAATFNGSVHISDPRFELWCDKLTVYLNRESEKEGADAPSRPPAGKTTGVQPPTGGGIDRAVAEGNVVIKQIRAAAAPGGETKTSIGRSERAEFTNRTGEIVLSGGRPSIEQGLNVLEATSSQTRIILARDNTLRTEGPSRTIIRQRGDSPDKISPPGRTAPPAAAESPKPRAPGARRPNR